METTNEEICPCIPRLRSPSRRRPPAACTGWLHRFPGKPNRYSRRSRLGRSVFCLGARSHQSQSPFFQIIRDKRIQIDKPWLTTRVFFFPSLFRRFRHQQKSECANYFPFFILFTTPANECSFI